MQKEKYSYGIQAPWSYVFEFGTKTIGNEKQLLGPWTQIFLTFIFTLYRSVHIRLQGRKKTLEFDVAALTLCKTASCPSLRVER